MDTTTRLKAGSPESYKVRAGKFDWHTCPLCQTSWNQPMLHCKVCRGHYQPVESKCPRCKTGSDKAIPGIRDKDYTGRMFDCPYGFRVTPVECEKIQTGKPPGLIKHSRCFSCDNSVLGIDQ